LMQAVEALYVIDPLPEGAGVVDALAKGEGVVDALAEGEGVLDPAVGRAPEPPAAGRETFALPPLHPAIAVIAVRLANINRNATRTIRKAFWLRIANARVERHSAWGLERTKTSLAENVKQGN
jgi:hypothetical protein